jgi:hypothetical protein
MNHNGRTVLWLRRILLLGWRLLWVISLRLLRLLRRVLRCIRPGRLLDLGWLLRLILGRGSTRSRGLLHLRRGGRLRWRGRLHAAATTGTEPAGCLILICAEWTDHLSPSMPGNQV